MVVVYWYWYWYWYRACSFQIVYCPLTLILNDLVIEIRLLCTIQLFNCDGESDVGRGEFELVWDYEPTERFSSIHIEWNAAGRVEDVLDITHDPFTIHCSTNPRPFLV